MDDETVRSTALRDLVGSSLGMVAVFIALLESGVEPGDLVSTDYVIPIVFGTVLGVAITYSLYKTDLYHEIENSNKSAIIRLVAVAATIGFILVIDHFRISSVPTSVAEFGLVLILFLLLSSSLYLKERVLDI